MQKFSYILNLFCFILRLVWTIATVVQMTIPQVVEVITLKENFLWNEAADYGTKSKAGSNRAGFIAEVTVARILY